MRTIHYLILGIIIVISIVLISVLTKYIEVKTGIAITSLVLVIVVILYFLLSKVPKRDYEHEGIEEANKKISD
jgi:c-di-AMP phosphodiesterase-like protein